MTFHIWLCQSSYFKWHSKYGYVRGHILNDIPYMVMAEVKFQLTNRNVKFPLYQYYGIYTEVLSVNKMFWMWTKYQTEWRENYCSSQSHVHMFLDLYTYHLYSLTPFPNTTGATSWAGTAFPSGTPEFTPGFYWSLCYSISSFMCMVCPFVLFLLAIVLSVLLRCTDSDSDVDTFCLLS